MIKLRLWGEKEEIERFAKMLHGLESSRKVRVLNESGDYPDRAPSAYHRRYIEVEIRGV